MDWRHERDCSSRVSDTQRKGGQHQQQNAKQEHLKEDGKGHDNVGTGEGGPEALYLPLDMGSYLIEFNEHVSIPLDAMGQLFVRSSLWRAGVWFGAGVVDSGYEGILGGLLTVVNPSGVVIYKNARIAQVVMTKLTEKIGEDDGYGGVYQGRNKL